MSESESQAIYAHSKESCEPDEWQLLEDHLRNVASRAAKFAASFGYENWGRALGLLHDAGKVSPAFQKRLHGSGERVDHSAPGAWEALRRYRSRLEDANGRLLAFAIAGHHGGMPNGICAGSEGRTPLVSRLSKEGVEKTAREFVDYAARVGLCLPEGSALEPLSLENLAIAGETNDTALARGIFSSSTCARMFFSCVVDADYLDTEWFMNPGAAAIRDGVARDDIAELSRRLDKHMEAVQASAVPSKVNEMRSKVLEACRSAAGWVPGIYTLTVPTGGGKTLASLSFALRHAMANGMSRVIYAIPYTSIVEQNARVFRSVLGDSNVLEHHSNVTYDLEEEANPQTIRLAKATENWDMPVVVTTAVQFFESLYACRSSQCRKLHNIAGSVVIFDEAQMLPVPYLRPCVWAISQLVEHYGVSAVLCTATQPALEPMFREFLPQIPVQELCLTDTCQWGIFRRVTFRQVGSLTWEELAAQLNAHGQVLCIVNTRKAAQEVYGRLDGVGNFHLSTLMCPSHRKAQLQEIRRRLKEGLPCRVVSTSLIEAGVDVDFPAVYREQAGLDSVLQAAGRCNREGRRPPEESLVHIFEGEEKAPPLFSTAIAAGKMAMSRHTDISSREAIHDYFSELLDLKGKEAQDKEGILPLIQSEFFPFRTVAERFHLIDSPTRTVYIPWGEGAELVEQLRAGGRGRMLFRQLGQYGVSIYEKHFVALDQAGDLEILENGAAILCNTALYSEKTGLSLDADSGKGLFI